jgi:hypothetical protein
MATAWVLWSPYPLKTSLSKFFNSSVFVNTALIQWAFNVKPDSSAPIDDLAFTESANTHPLPFKVIFEPRAAKSMEGIRELIEEYGLWNLFIFGTNLSHIFGVFGFNFGLTSSNLLQTLLPYSTISFIISLFALSGHFLFRYRSHLFPFFPSPSTRGHREFRGDTG